jgi:hypothetical protein
MYQDPKQNFWWSNMKVDIAKYVAEWKQAIWIRQVYSNPCRYPCGTGTILVWISLWVYS